MLAVSPYINTGKMIYHINIALAMSVPRCFIGNAITVDIVGCHWHVSKDISDLQLVLPGYLDYHCSTNKLMQGSRRKCAT